MGRFLMLFALLLSLQSCTQAAEIKVLSWNVESDRPNADTNDPAEISAQLEALQNQRGPYDLIALTEVRSTSSDAYESAVEVNGIEYRAFTSRTGDTDRMMLLVRADRFEVVGNRATELQNDGRRGRNAITFPGGASRRPFLVRLRDSQNNDLEFIFMVNHLTRGNQQVRRRQAEGLREWARIQTVPVIAAGDYNFDFDFRNLTGNRSMAIFSRRDASDGGAFVWSWIIPGAEFEVEGDSDSSRRVTLLAQLIDTNWAGNNGQDRFRDSMLDFIFVAQGARDWGAKSTVIVRENDFPDDNRSSDHRPVEAMLDPQGEAVDVGGPRD